MNKLNVNLLAISFVGSLLVTAMSHANQGHVIQSINKTKQPIVIDGQVDKAWEKAVWLPLNHHILGKEPTSEDFTGRFKLLWDKQYLYVMAEIHDDVLFDQHADPLYRYWDDDCLEIFVDEDASGGDHETNFNAFAYHIALDNQAIDIGPNNPDGSTQFIALNDHVVSNWKRAENSPHQVTWEVAVKLYDDTFTLSSTSNKPQILTENKAIGFMLAYCDNDGSKEREHFYGSTEIKPIKGDKNLGFKTADVFSRFILKK